MKLLFVFLFITLTGFSQYPIIEEFDSFGGAGEWTVNNGAGVQNYGGVENWATFNIGNIPYPNSTTITIESPVYDLTDCLSDLQITFPIRGVIEDGFDNVYFQYRIGGGMWITIDILTGFQAPFNLPITKTYLTIPNTATRFRFILVTDSNSDPFLDCIK